ncbi:MAG: 50S ribosomal protein L22 [Candidatus Krumholzibacteriia bacterium]
MQAMAVARFIRVSPRKTRLVADLVRGKTVQDALNILALTPKKASPILRKAILSAAANAQVLNDRSTDLSHEALLVSEIRIDEGPTLKRIRPRAQGRAYRINKRTSHIKVTVETLD